MLNRAGASAVVTTPGGGYGSRLALAWPGRPRSEPHAFARWMIRRQGLFSHCPPACGGRVNGTMAGLPGCHTESLSGHRQLFSRLAFEFHLDVFELSFFKLRVVEIRLVEI